MVKINFIEIIDTSQYGACIIYTNPIVILKIYIKTISYSILMDPKQLKYVIFFSIFAAKLIAANLLSSRKSFLILLSAKFYYSNTLSFRLTCPFWFLYFLSFLLKNPRPSIRFSSVLKNNFLLIFRFSYISSNENADTVAEKGTKLMYTISLLLKKRKIQFKNSVVKE